MKAFHSDKKVKAVVLKQLRAHEKADEIIKGRYWEDGKGCAVGCTIHSNQHVEYETRFGIPQVLARLEDTIFEGLPNAEAKTWPVSFMSAIKPGADLSRVHWKFLHWTLTNEGVNPGINHPLVKDAVKRCADLMADLAAGKTPTESAAWSARAAASAAESAASAAESAARSAAESAASAAESAAESARAAAESAAWSARAARSAAESAAWSAWSASSWMGVKERYYSLMAKKLLSLLKGAT